MMLGRSSGFRAPSRVDPISGALWSHKWTARPALRLCQKESGRVQSPPPKGRKLSPTPTRPDKSSPPAPPPATELNDPLRGKEISSRGHGQRPKGRFSVAACLGAPCYPSALQEIKTAAPAKAQQNRPQREQRAVAPGPPFWLRNINRLPFRYGSGTW